MLTRDQEKQAVALLREALDWVGLVELTVEEEERADDLQERIQRLLVDCGALPGARSAAVVEIELYRRVLEARQQTYATEQERIASRALLNAALSRQDAAVAVAAVRRYNRAYAEHEAACGVLQGAEQAYHRALEGGRRCSA